jgi:hypothetical protein
MQSLRHQPMGSVAEPRFCAMGSQCTHARFLDGKPVRLRSTSSSQLCAQCEEAELSPDDVPEEHDELFHAARVLLREGVDDNDLIIPTLAFAARASVADKPWLAQLRICF